MINFRYVFRYVLLGLPSATECSQVQPSAELTSQVLPKAPKNFNTKSHVGADVSINSVVESNLQTHINKGKTRVFSMLKNYKLHVQSTFRYYLENLKFFLNML